MREGSWLSRLLGRKAEGQGAPLSPVRREGSASQAGRADDDAGYRQHRDWSMRELKAGRVEEAVNALGRAVHLRPELLEAHLNMGRVLHQAGKIEAARQAYQRALELDLTCAEARSALATLPPPPPTREDFQVGQVLRSGTAQATYRVLEVKKGGFGAVYIVQMGESGARCALKTFQARYLWSDDDRERFEREAVTWVMLDRHPNIVTAHCVERIEGFPCLVLEYVPGGDLERLLRKGPLPVERALELALQFCDGMAYAHEKLGIVHRDVKPANCLLTQDGTLKVTDFGLARAFGQAQEEVLGLSGFGVEVRSQYTTPLGTRQYMAPEQFRAAARLDTRTDIYGFGIMLHQMLTRDLPLDGRAAQARIQENAALHHMPERMLPLILKCVEPDPRKRPADFAEVRGVLGTVYQAMTGTAAPAPAEPSPMGATEWSDKGIALQALGRHEEALACHERGLEIDPRRGSLWNNKGLALRAVGRHEEALACYERGLEIDPRDSHLWNNKGAALHALGRPQEALASFERGLRIDPRDRTLWYNKGLALADLWRYEEALACYERGLEIDPRDSQLWNNKAVALDALGRPQEALASLERGLEFQPRDSRLWHNKGVALQALGRTQEAEVCFRRARELGGG
jgi:tetratricopeptide (TPR) repeat protein